MAVNTIGINGTYADVQAWRTGVKGGTAGAETAQLISNVIETGGDIALDNGWNTSGTWVLTIEGKRKNDRKYKWTADDGFDLIEYGDSGVTATFDLTVKDLHAVGDLTGGRSFVDTGAYTVSGSQPLAIVNCIIEDFDIGIHLRQNSEHNTTIDSVLIIGGGSVGIDFRQNGGITTVLVRGSGIFGMSSRGIDIRSSMNDGTIEVQNTWLMNSGSQDIQTFGTTVTIIKREVVTSDATGTNADNSTVDNCASGKSSYSTYFDAHLLDDFHYKDDTTALFGIEGDPANSPTKDLDNLIRTFKDIGPYDHFERKTIGPSQDFATLSLWETNTEGLALPGNYEAILKADIVDTMILGTSIAQARTIPTFHVSRRRVSNMKPSVTFIGTAISQFI